ncbi:hypothetical protein G7Y79_00051g086470 [Physcia stellaris]|nr:hypothetical protein G7Y79_00051g086470 [Physcia stellaris]
MMPLKQGISAVDTTQKLGVSSVERSPGVVGATQTWLINGEKPQSMPSTLVLDPPNLDEAAAPGHVRQMFSDTAVAGLRPDYCSLGPYKAEAQVAPSFLTLPLELRRAIYRHVLCYNYRLRKKTWYLLPQSFLGRNLLGLPNDDTSLFCVCQQIYNETLNIFYEVNVFSLHSKMLKPGSFENLHHLQHVDFTFNYRSNIHADSAPIQLPKQLKCLVAFCPRLRTFSLLGMRYKKFADPYVDSKNKFLQALLSMKASDTFEGLHLVVPFENPDTWPLYYDFLNSVAPAAHWSCVLERGSTARLKDNWQAKAYMSPKEHKFRKGFSKIDNREREGSGFEYVASTENLEDWFDFPEEYEFEY